MLLFERIQKIIDDRRFPNADEFETLFMESPNLYIAQEGVNWDFKETWPHSYSDDYFLGIVRLVAAFANTLGGYIIFGVHDEKRTGGKNLVKVNTDKFRQTVASYLGACPVFDTLHYEFLSGGVDCLFVPPRPLGVSPYRFIKPTKYGNHYYVRVDHSVAPADSQHLPLLFCRIDQTSKVANFQPIPGSIPPTPRKLSKFVGRMQAMDNLFDWLINSDEPQIYLYGKGGSGKTTIAHEFASTIKRHGAELCLNGTDSLDLVIFLSAKERSFSTESISATIEHEADFSDERSLFAQLLRFSGLYSAQDELDKKDINQLRTMIKEFFDEFSALIVLDDIDTLTTKNVEVGTTFLYKTLARAKRTSRILCTQRNIPSHAIGTSIEVPGLTMDGEYQQFVAECVKSYSVRAPSKEEDAKIAKLSECRPLVVEYLIALSRTTPNYDAAFRLFEGDTGNDLRNYVFSREWTSLESGNDARMLLATLALLNRPASTDDILAIMQIGERRLFDAVASCRAMFLKINDAGGEATYSLDTLTREFVMQELNTIVQIGALRARVKHFNKSYHPDVPQISRIVIRVDDCLRKAQRTRDYDHVVKAWKIVNDPSISSEVSEHPQFKSVYGYVAAKLHPLKLDDVRRNFRLAIDMKYDPSAAHMRAWYEAEKSSGIGIQQCVEIADYVVNGRSYSEQDKIDFLSLKGTSLYHRAREIAHDEPVEALKNYFESLRCHVQVFKHNADTNGHKLGISESYTRNTTFSLLDHVVNNFKLEKLVTSVEDVLHLKVGYLDPVEEPICEILRKLNVRYYEASELHKAKKVLHRLLTAEEKYDRWMDRSCLDRVRASLLALEKTVEPLLRR